MRVRRVAHDALRVPADVRRWAGIARSRSAQGAVRVSYGGAAPTADAVAHGGRIKLLALAREFGDRPRDFNLLYLVSSAPPHDARMLIRLARLRRAPIVVNQNGVAYPAWHGPGWERTNRPLTRVLHSASHVVYQSRFCKLSADHFCGEPHVPWEVLHNPVDTAHFTPGARQDGPPTLLLGGNQYQRYRFESALATLLRLSDEWRLIVTGDLSWFPDRRRSRAEGRARIAELGLVERVSLPGSYTQADAPALFRRADILLHTKVNDPCPTTVLEAMACGLPVVHSATGGTPELVGESGGIGLPAPLDWEQERPPDPGALAAAVQETWAQIDERREAARARAELFDIRPWVQRHRELFEVLTG
jgi:glycosyltransferase involved in cell wall biosynthesis